jgi:hypothetical protein
MKLKILLFTLAGLLMVSPLALADTLVGSTSGSWTALPEVVAGGIDNNGIPFFDHSSWDGATNPGNVGYVLQPGGTYNLPSLDYWSINGAVDPNVSFIKTSPSEQVVLLFEIAGNKNNNALYIYNIDNPSNSLITVFNGTDSPTTSTVVVPYTNYGYVLVGPGGTFYSDAAAKRTDSTSDGNFAFFAPTGTYTGTAGQYSGNAWYVGVEDLSMLGCTDIDYQDMVFKVSTTDLPAPLPPSALLLGTGLLGLVGLRKFRKG